VFRSGATARAPEDHQFHAQLSDVYGTERDGGSEAHAAAAAEATHEQVFAFDSGPPAPAAAAAASEQDSADQIDVYGVAQSSTVLMLENDCVEPGSLFEVAEDFNPAEGAAGKLAVSEGEIVDVHTKDEGGWWYVSTTSRVYVAEGWVPSDFLDPYDEETPLPPPVASATYETIGDLRPVRTRR